MTCEQLLNVLEKEADKTNVLSKDIVRDEEREMKVVKETLTRHVFTLLSYFPQYLVYSNKKLKFPDNLLSLQAIRQEIKTKW